MLDQKALKSALTTLKPYVHKVKPQLTLTFSPDKLTLSTTDLDLLIELFLPCENSFNTSLTVNFHEVFDFIKSMTGQISFIPQANLLQIGSGIASKTIATIPPEDVLKPFAKLETTTIKTSTFNFKAFLEALNNTSVCISDESTRYYLQGVYLHNDAQGIPTIAATNGHILACEQLAGHKYIGPQVIIPKCTVSLIQKLSKSFAETFLFQITDEPNTQANTVVIETENFKIISKTIDGTYPDYNRIIPKQDLLDSSFTIDAKLLPDLGKKEDINHCQFTRGGFTVDGIDYSVPTGLPTDFVIAFNANYLRRFITKANSLLTIHYTSDDPIAPCRIDNKSNSLNVIMPRRPR